MTGHRLDPTPSTTVDVFSHDLHEGPPAWLLWQIDADAGIATSSAGHTVRIAPFHGVTGVAWDEPGEQGDGEVAGTAIECGMTTELQLELVTNRPVPGVHAETPAGAIS